MLNFRRGEEDDRRAKTAQTLEAKKERMLMKEGIRDTDFDVLMGDLNEMGRVSWGER